MSSATAANPPAELAANVETDDGERAPLLVSKQPTFTDIVTEANDDTDDVTVVSRDEDVQREVQKGTWRTFYVWGVFALVAIVLLAWFIKGMVESGNVKFDLKGALVKALGGGLAGAAAMVLQVFLFMPIRTVMNYQYRYGTTMTQATKILYREGGLRRYYAGLLAALIQGPVSRFGDTAANSFSLAFLESNPNTDALPEFVKTGFSAIVAALFRMVLLPVDTVKTTMQTQGKPGTQILRSRIRMYGVGTLWYGAWATAAASIVGYYPWFATYNFLKAKLPPSSNMPTDLLRQAFIGFVASLISDTISNSLRVVKTYRQVNETRVGYVDAARAVVAADGWKGLFGRGLKTRILANGLQGLVFSVLWKLFLDLWNKKTD